MREFRLSPAAVEDLGGIWDYTEEHWDIAQAERYLQTIRSAVEELASNPHRGRDASHVRPGYRAYFVGSHVLYFRVSATSVDVVRILHQRMDPGRHLWDWPESSSSDR